MSARWSRALRPWLLIRAALLCAVASCGSSDVTGPPPLPPGVQRLPPQAQYAQWWHDTEQCSGVRADLGRVEWYVVPNEDHFVYRGRLFDAYWWSVHWVVIASAFVEDSGIVRHEMLHDLLDRGDHPAEYFQQKCAGVVTCNAECRAEGAR